MLAIVNKSTLLLFLLLISWLASVHPVSTASPASPTARRVWPVPFLGGGQPE